MTWRILLGRAAIGAALLALPAGAVATAHAQMRHERGPGWSRDGGLALPLLIRAAHLTPERDEKVRAILAGHRAVTRNAVQAADLQPPLKQIAALREQLLQDSAQIALEVRAVLTPEQLVRAGQLRSRMRQIQSELQPPDRP